jgi:hypothetical protein
MFKMCALYSKNSFPVLFSSFFQFHIPINPAGWFSIFQRTQSNVALETKFHFNVKCGVDFCRPDVFVCGALVYLDMKSDFSMMVKCLIQSTTQFFHRSCVLYSLNWRGTKKKNNIREISEHKCTHKHSWKYKKEREFKNKTGNEQKRMASPD